MLSTATKISIARGIYGVLRLVRSPFGARDQVEVRRSGVTWRLDLREGIDLTIYLAGAFERPTLRQLQRLVKPGMNVIDIGANVGAHTLHLARQVGSTGSVLAFEPTAWAYGKLKDNLAANPELAGRVSAHQAFLVAGGAKEVDLHIASSWPVDGRKPDDLQMGSVGMSTMGATALTLDEAVRAAGDARISLIKMDVDGHELSVLRGASELLRRDAPIIVMELAPYVFKPTTDFDAMIELLWGGGYDMVPIGKSQTLPRSVAAVRGIIPQAGSLNVTATKRAANSS